MSVAMPRITWSPAGAPPRGAPTRGRIARATRREDLAPVPKRGHDTRRVLARGRRRRRRRTGHGAARLAARLVAPSGSAPRRVDVHADAEGDPLDAPRRRTRPRPGFPPACSARPASTSLGHLSRAGTPSDSSAVAHGHAAEQRARGRLVRSGAQEHRKIEVAGGRHPASALGGRVPPSWASASTTARSGAPSRAQSFSRSLVDPSEAWCSIGRGPGFAASPRSGPAGARRPRALAHAGHAAAGARSRARCPPPGAEWVRAPTAMRSAPASA